MIQSHQLSSPYVIRNFPPAHFPNPFRTLDSYRHPQPDAQRSRVYGGIMYVPHSDPTQERYALVYGRYSGKWSFPKGHSQEGESPMECAQREIAEETGIEVLPESSKYIRLGFANYFLFPFPFYLPLVPKDMNEICDTRWATMDEMKHMPINVDVSRYRRLWMKQHEMTNEV